MKSERTKTWGLYALTALAACSAIVGCSDDGESPERQLDGGPGSCPQREPLPGDDCNFTVQCAYASCGPSPYFPTSQASCREGKVVLQQCSAPAPASDAGADDAAIDAATPLQG